MEIGQLARLSFWPLHAIGSREVSKPSTPNRGTAGVARTIFLLSHPLIEGAVGRPDGAEGGV